MTNTMKLVATFGLICMADASTQDKNRPVAKVVNLLKDMQKNLQKEQEEDEATFNKLACWCETNDKAKTQAIEEAESSISQVTSKIESLSGNSARLNVEIKNLATEVAKNQEALAEATEIRKKELAEFNAEEKDNLQSISALKSAVTVLSKHHKPPQEALLNVATVLRHVTSNHGDLLTYPESKAVATFLQAPKDYLNAEPIFKQSYAPQSGEIFGILQNMLETFQSNLAASQKDETTAQKAFEELKAAKETEIADGKEHLMNKKQELATTDENLSNSKEEIEDTRNSLAADQEFLMDLKEKCQMTNQEWEQRQKTRAEEVQAVSEALTVLSGDDAHDLFSRTFNPALLQTVSSSAENQREAAANVLALAASQFRNPSLSALATQVRLDSFSRVKKAIDDMVSTLVQEKEDEIKQKDFCIDELNTNEKNDALKNRERQELEAATANLKSEIKTLASEIDKLNGEVVELNKQLKSAGEDRAAENKDFQLMISDSRASQQLLNQALNVLKGFYAQKKKGTTLVQDPVGPPPPPGFKKYQKQAGAGGVLGLLQQIINDAKVMEAEAVTAESGAQKAYETFVKGTNDSVETKQTTIVDKQEIKAKKEKDQAAMETDLNNTMTELEELANSAAALHKSCDFIVKNFDTRQQARDQEVEALRQAKAILSGSSFGTFLQRS